MKKYLFLLLSLFLIAPLQAQVIIYGLVTDDVSGSAIADAQIRIPGTNLSTLSNADGRFTLRLDSVPARLDASAVGYRNAVVRKPRIEESLRHEVGSRNRELKIMLHPTATMLKDVFVYSPDNILQAAIEKIKVNYRQSPETYAAFYRETIRKRKTYVGVSEAVVNMYKRSYEEDPDYDQVHILKGRTLVSQRQRDTLSVHVQGGPTEALFLDFVKNRCMLLNEEVLQYYKLEIETPQTINDRPQYVISFTPTISLPDEPLYYGLIYIDYATLSFTRIEMNLDVTDRYKATKVMLARKPLGMRFRPRGLQTIVNYYHDGQHSDIAYMRTTYNFDCDWKKRGIAVKYEAVSEMLVTDHHATTEQPRRRDSFRRSDVLGKKVSDFEDPDFWEEYNILQPSESLENAVKKLKKINDKENKKK